VIALMLVSAALAANDEGVLADRLPPVAGNVVTKAGRVELFPSVAFSFRDSFFRKTAPSLAVGFHLSDVVGITARASYNLTTEAASIQVCPPDGSGCRTLNRDELGGRAPGQLVLTVGGEAEFAPFYGKWSILAEGFLNADLYLSLGAYFVGYIGAGNAFRPTIGGAGALGLRLSFTRWLALRFEARDLVYPEELTLGEKNVVSVRNQLYAQVGLSFLLPSFAAEKGAP
jgi:outer membrane beta-barrel protein